MNQNVPTAPVEPAAPPASPRVPPATPPRRKGHGWIWLLLLAIAAVAGYYFYTKSANSGKGGDNGQAAEEGGKGGKKGRGGRGGVPPVVVTRAQRGNIGVVFTGLGSVWPIYTVTIKARVDGQLMDILYKEGDIVQKGAPLIKIDPRPYEVQLEQAQGQLARDQAILDNARVDEKRYETLLAQNAVPEQQLTQQKALVQQYEGVVKADQGQIASAQLNITYTNITAPITGRIGLRLVDPGNIVHASDQNGLLVITQIQPISVIFTLAETQLPAVMDKLRAHQTLRVDAYDANNSKKLATGILTTIDNQIDQTTGSLRLRAEFDNRDGALFPNEMVNARLLVEEKRNVVLLNTPAIQRTSNSTYVFLVKPDNTVTVRQITVGTSEGDQSEITSGLEPNDIVVMTGVDKLNEGTHVTAQFENGQSLGGGRGGRGGRGGHGGQGAQGAETGAPAGAAQPAGNPNAAPNGNGNEGGSGRGRGGRRGNRCGGSNQQ